MAELYRDQRKYVVFAINPFDDYTVVQEYQAIYPEIIMLWDVGGTVYGEYGRQWMPLHYVISREQIVKWFSISFEWEYIKQNIVNRLQDVTFWLRPYNPNILHGNNLRFNLEVKNWVNEEFTIGLFTEIVSFGTGDTIQDIIPVMTTLNPYQVISNDLTYPTDSLEIGDYLYHGELWKLEPDTLADFSWFEFSVKKGVLLPLRAKDDDWIVTDVKAKISSER